MNREGIRQNSTPLMVKGFAVQDTAGGGSPPLWRRYLVGLACVLCAFGIRYWLTPILGEELPFMFFVAASLVAAWYGGAATGIVALLLGLCLADFFFLPPRGVAGVPHSVELLQFIRYFFTASLGIALIEVLHRDRRRTRAAVEELRLEVARRERSEAALSEAQEQLRRHAADLERRVAERTAQLTVTIESLRSLLYHIAHNLRAPLRALEGYSTLLVERASGKLDATAQDHCERIAQAARRMDRLIQDLLEYGRLSHIEIELSRVNLHEAVTAALEQLAPAIKDRGGEIAVREKLPGVTAHFGLLQAVLVRVLENALEFVAPGVTPRVSISAEERGSRVRLWVEDNGVGIDPKYQDRIFDVFVSLYPSDTAEGTGIGLAIAKEVMERLGGSVGVESTPGRGSRFWLEFASAA